MANQAAAQPLTATFYGFIATTMDALVLFEACLSGILYHAARRPHDRERGDLIRSGNIFIYEEHSSGIKRWTDGVAWSPSRILGNFLIYRELDKPFQPGEKKRAMKRGKGDGVTKPANNHRVPHAITSIAGSSSSAANLENSMNGGDSERALIGSLVDSYQFKADGLVKKTISVQYHGVHHHLVSYYNIEDIKTHFLKSVVEAPSLRAIVPRSELLSASNFRSPIDDGELSIDPSRASIYVPTGMDYAQMHGMPARSISIPPQQGYAHSQQWAAQHYGHSQPYGAQQTLQAPTPNYGQPLMSPYSYDAAYATPSRLTTYSPVMLPVRRHSVVANTNDTSPLGYQTSVSGLPVNESEFAAHGLSSDSYLNGEMFSSSAANAVAQSASMGSMAGYDPTNSIQQGNGAHSMVNSAPHHPAGFDGQLPDDFEESTNQLSINDFGGPIPEPTGSNFGLTNAGTTPTNLGLAMDNPESSVDNEWDRTNKKRRSSGW
ncbi:putative Gti1 Pac2 family protein [Rosellinia necatrix]|uniref:Putative Gti1 Pac2 family protein n=1 Tax=Rosellinia necatrix TaxID=77044 RepID=A0A1W2THW8_ROSNE|nr:putative Gti1 Pac2 family protein [Rosellinia necatrix]